MIDRVHIRKLRTGIQGLDEVIGGGMPEFSFNLIAGGPGCGKTTLAHQFMFANATEERKAVYFTVFGEPQIKMLRYQQQFDFFDGSKVGNVVRFVHLGQEMIEGGLNRVLERIRHELETVDARIVVVDSFRSVARVANPGREEKPGFEEFVQLLALMLTSYEATTFLIGEYQEQESHSSPIFTVADGIIWLFQMVARNSVVRRVQILKMRGGVPIPGLHTVRLSDQGVRIFPRLPVRAGPAHAPPVSAAPKRTGVSGLDEMLGGGIPAGYSMLVAGPSGSGKTTLAAQFVLEGFGQGEKAVIAVFEQRPEDYLSRLHRREDVAESIREGKAEIVHIRPLDLSVEETLEELGEAVMRLGAKRVVIDSLSGFEIALAPTFRDDFRESLYRMVRALTGLGVTVMMVVELTDSFTELRLSSEGTSFLSDGIILQRYVEIGATLKKVMAVVKLRASSHSNDFREYEVTDKGVLVAGVRPARYRGLLTGVPVAAVPAPPAKKARAKPAKKGRGPAASPRRRRA